MAKRGRKPKYSKKFLKELAEKFDEYIRNTEIPIIAEFAAQNGLYKQFFYDHDEFSDLIKKALTKKEASLERLGLEGKLNPTMVVFSLKQMGWSDRQEHKHEGKIEIELKLPEDLERMKGDENKD